MRPFSYLLPKERIAERPCHPAEAARLLYSAGAGEIKDLHFYNLPEVLPAASVLVFNNTKVLPARIFAELPTGGAVQLLVTSSNQDGSYVALGQPIKKLKPGTQLLAGDTEITVIQRLSEREIKILASANLFELGVMPIPPYIRSGRGDTQDIADYQTVFAKYAGSIAAPTASLHFSKNLLQALMTSGIIIEEVTLHLGVASFLPVVSESGEVTAPQSEALVYDSAMIARLSEYRSAGRKIIAVGTSVVRWLESVGTEGATPDIAEHRTELFIKPGHVFANIDGMITNFHQPGSSHLLLVEAFTGAEQLAKIYNHALQGPYNFLSYGDGMLLL